MTGEKAREILTQFKTEFEPRMMGFFDERRSGFQEEFDDHSVFAFDALADLSTRNGKRLRASFVTYAYEMFGGDDRSLALEIGVVVELLHTYILIMDDIADESSLRRGSPTAHKLFEAYYDSIANKEATRDHSEHYGVSMGLTAGILCCHIALEHFHSLKIDADLKVRMARELNRNLKITGCGQLLDISNAITASVDEAEVITMLQHKTSVYTYKNPIYLGAILAEVDDSEVMSALETYCIAAGIAFQIQDDILGVYGVNKETGKSNVDDLREGKHTLLINCLLNNGSKQSIDAVKKVLGNQNISPEDLEKVKMILKEEGALGYSQDKVRQYTEIAKNALSSLRNSYDNEGLAYLYGIVDLMINRKS